MAGVVPAIIAALGFAVFQLANHRVLARVDIVRVLAAVLAAAAGVLVLATLATGGLGGLLEAGPVALAWAVGAGLLHFLLGWTLLAMSQVRIGAAGAGILTTTVPLFGAAIAAVLLDETLDASGGIAVLLVVGGVATVVSVRRSGPVQTRPRLALGVLAGLGTSLCWASSPVLIRQALDGPLSPVAGAAVGMAASALVYLLRVRMSGSPRRDPMLPSDRRTLVVSGVAVGIAIWMQWTAYDATTVVIVLSLLQLTPVLVVGYAFAVLGEGLTRLPPRVVIGTVVTVTGSVLLIMTGG